MITIQDLKERASADLSIGEAKARVGELEDWQLQEMIEIYNNLPGSEKGEYYNPEDL